MIRTFFLSQFVMVVVLSCTITSCNAQEDLDFQKLVNEVDSSGVFFSNDNYTWCSSVIKGGTGKDHTYYSSW